MFIVINLALHAMLNSLFSAFMVYIHICVF